MRRRRGGKRGFWAEVRGRDALRFSRSQRAAIKSEARKPKEIRNQKSEGRTPLLDPKHRNTAPRAAGPFRISFLAHSMSRRRAMTSSADWALSLPERKAPAVFLPAAAVSARQLSTRRLRSKSSKICRSSEGKRSASVRTRSNVRVAIDIYNVVCLEDYLSPTSESVNAAIALRESRACEGTLLEQN